MERSTKRGLAFVGAGSLLAAGFFGRGIAENLQSEQDGRAPYPASTVCATYLMPGESPYSLAESSAFAADAQLVLERSQFVNPDAVLQYGAGDESHFSGEFNVLRQVGNRDDVVEYFDGPLNYMESDSCTIGSSAGEVVSEFPSLNAAERILGSTAAVIERNERDNETISQWRCGAVAVSKNVLLMPSRDFASGSSACADLKSGEIGETPLKIESDVTNGAEPWRYLTVSGASLKPVEIAYDYVPKVNDVLVYSGYDQGGSREYFRMVVGGVKDGRMLLIAGVDQTDPNEPRDHDEGIGEMHIHGGGGGLFTMGGRLVGVVESTNSFKRGYGGYSEEYAKSLQDYNDSLEKWLQYFGIFDRSDDYYKNPRQYVSALLTNSINPQNIPSN